MNVSVLIPVYNAAEFLRNAVSSALKLPEVQEVILIEDGSPDDSLSICKEITAEDSRIKLFQHPGGINKGAGASRNLGMHKATQEYVAFLDADDRYTSIRFQRDKEIFEDHPECEAVYGAMGVHIIDEIGASNWKIRGLDESHLTAPNKEVPYAQLFEHLIGFSKGNDVKGYFSIVTLTLKRECLIDNKIFFPIELRLHQDTVFLWKCAYYLKCFSGEIAKPVAMRTVHQGNRFITNKNEAFTRSLMWRNVLFWSRKENLPKAIMSFFQQKYASNLQQIESRSTRLKFILKDLIDYRNSANLSTLGIRGVIKALIH